MNKITYCLSHKKSPNFINQVIKLDATVYPVYERDTVKNCKDRLKLYDGEYALAYDKDKLIGYISFVPIKKEFYSRILKSNYMIDNGKGKLKNVNGKSKRFIIISVVVDKKYQHHGIAKKLIKFWLNSHSFQSIICYTVSPYSFHLLMKEFKFKFIKHIELGIDLIELKGNL